MYSEITHNKRKSILILVIFVLIIAALADILGAIYAHGSPAVLIGVVIGSLIYATISYYAGMRLSLAVNQAKEIQKKEQKFENDFWIKFEF